LPNGERAFVVCLRFRVIGVVRSNSQIIQHLRPVRRIASHGNEDYKCYTSAGMNEDLQQALKTRISGEVRFDKVSRLMYSTDASIYEIEPMGVVLPRTHEDVVATM